MHHSGAPSKFPKVSVVVTCYNNHKTILKAVNSVISQTYQNLEIILVDDCSSDGSLDKLREVSDERLLIVRLPVNSGVSAARNAGHDKVTGEYVTQLDGDDFFHPNKVASEVSVAFGNPGVAVYSKFVVIRGGRQTIDYGGFFIKGKKLSLVGLLYRIEYVGRDWLIPVNISKRIRYDESRNLYEDWHYQLQVAMLCPVVFSRSIGTYYVKSSASLSTRPWSDHRDALTSIFHEYSNSFSASIIFKVLHLTKYGGKVLAVLMNWTRIYRMFPF